MHHLDNKGRGEVGEEKYRMQMREAEFDNLTRIHTTHFSNSAKSLGTRIAAEA